MKARFFYKAVFDRSQFGIFVVLLACMVACAAYFRESYNDYIDLLVQLQRVNIGCVAIMPLFVFGLRTALKSASSAGFLLDANHVATI
ncbi:hypothetical protein KPC83_03355 [Collinsella sp. zg1085]|uniref:hypothetical protein n=1 Tax=Collinsella sp. zg1085 TaxID=2844380 RepID=UPI001C0B4034|nr:hypothetical protein [Collinsella sp. zg1085]QWT18180.1 hypothetical protein KPC83_03355 [Collinsella sp. zg1085]